MTGAYDLEGVIWHQHSNRLMKKILELWPDKHRRIRDLGCGHNFYISVLSYAGYGDVLGYDLVDLGSKHFRKVDVTSEMEIMMITPANVLSLEVGEHIPARFSGAYIHNLTKVANGGDIIMSWAIPGQAGYGHINCQDNGSIEEQMKNRGYRMDIQKTAQLRQAVYDCHCSWLKNTLMYYTPA